LVPGRSEATVQPAPTGPVVVADQSGAASLEASFMKIADTIGPATVSVQADVEAPARRGRQELEIPDDPLDLFQGPPRGPRSGTSVGSGVIVDASGSILTNDHVVEGAKNGRVTVKLADGTTYPGTVSRDPRSDLAVVKIKAGKPLPYVRFADSDALKVGQWAVAIGSPFGKENTMTTGIVSALHRKTDISDGMSGRYYPSLIQTDAAINRGNSGGPLLNIRGELIGINVAIFSPTGTSAGIGFAIPANTAKVVMDQLIAKGRVVRGSLGVVPEDVPADLRGALGTTQGAYIRQVTVGSPADKAGLQAGDVIVRFNNKPITDEAMLRDSIAAAGPGANSQIEVLREGKRRTVTALLGELKENRPGAPTPAEAKPYSDRAQEMGFRIESITPDAREKMALPAEIDGLLVRNVEPGSVADTAGLRPGMIVVQANSRPVATAKGFDSLLAKLKSGDLLTLRVVTYVEDGSDKPLMSRGIVALRMP
jgi:serine protease Do